MVAARPDPKEPATGRAPWCAASSGHCGQLARGLHRPAEDAGEPCTAQWLEEGHLEAEEPWRRFAQGWLGFVSQSLNVPGLATQLYVLGIRIRNVCSWLQIDVCLRMVFATGLKIGKKSK